MEAGIEKRWKNWRARSIKDKMLREAAPEMLIALRKAKKALFPHNDKKSLKALDRVNEAIKKATEE